jgi:DNA-binding transcriptional MocR family regulator
MRRGVVFALGDSFSPNGEFGHAMRLNFTHAEPEAIDRGIRILAEEISAMV